MKPHTITLRTPGRSGPKHASVRLLNGGQHRRHVAETTRRPSGSGGFQPEITPARITEIRRQIAAGTYVTSEKLDIAVERLFAALANEWPLGAAVG